MSNEHYLQITWDRDLGGGNHAVNTYHVAPDAGGWVGADTTAIANYWIGRLKTFYEACNAGGFMGGGSIGNVVVEYEYDEAPVYVPATAQTPAEGSGGSVYPYQLAGVVSWRTGLAGRAYRGRTFLGPLRASAISSSSMTSTWTSAVNAACTTLIAGGVGSFKLAVVSKSGNHVHKDGSSTWHDGFTTHITSGSTSQAVRTMRSRA